MTTVYIIRHAQAEGNLYRRCHGWYNSLLTPKGYRQVSALENRFQDVHIDAVYSSDLFRTMATAQALCRPKGLPLRLDPDLREVGMGIWEDLPWGEALQIDRECMAAFLRCDPNWSLEGSDTFPGAQERFCAAVERHARAHPGQTIACFAHGAVIRAAFAHWMGLPLDRIADVPLGENTCVSRLDITNDQVFIRFYADDSHLNTPDVAGPSRSSTGSGLERLEQAALYFRPLHLPTQKELYLSWRADGWMASHGTMDGFDGDSFLSAAEQAFACDPTSILLACAKDTAVGILQLDPKQEAEFGVGRIPFLYVRPEYRSRGYGVQMLGHAVYTFRKLGRNRLRLRCAPENARAQQFYLQNGLKKIGEESGGVGHLDTMELYIGIELN